MVSGRSWRCDSIPEVDDATAMFIHYYKVEVQ
jgi:hypothetical protein